MGRDRLLTGQHRAGRSAWRQRPHTRDGHSESRVLKLLRRHRRERIRNHGGRPQGQLTHLAAITKNMCDDPERTPISWSVANHCKKWNIRAVYPPNAVRRIFAPAKTVFSCMACQILFQFCDLSLPRKRTAGSSPRTSPQRGTCCQGPQMT